MNKVRWIIIGVVILGLVAAYTQELPIMMNYLQVDAFWQTGLLIGLLVGITTLLLLFFYSNLVPDDVVTKMRWGSSILFTSMLLCPLFLSWTNRLGIPDTNAKDVPIVYESEQARYSSRFGNIGGEKQQANQFILFFFQDGQLHRVNGVHPFFPGAQAGDTLQLRINTGRWHYQWVVK
ncbi:hypothetical protein [Lewinella sp. LCG006]|uniref:hypothetical protein n=1 Tax=Lewinella sp. LCG006 TaxID=3231911 RepID=UPI003460E253